MEIGTIEHKIDTVPMDLFIIEQIALCIPSSTLTRRFLSTCKDYRSLLTKQLWLNKAFYLYDVDLNNIFMSWHEHNSWTVYKRLRFIETLKYPQYGGIVTDYFSRWFEKHKIIVLNKFLTSNMDDIQIIESIHNYKSHIIDARIFDYIKHIAETNEFTNFINRLYSNKHICSDPIELLNVVTDHCTKRQMKYFIRKHKLLRDTRALVERIYGIKQSILQQIILELNIRPSGICFKQ